MTKVFQIMEELASVQSKRRKTNGHEPIATKLENSRKYHFNISFINQEGVLKSVLKINRVVDGANVVKFIGAKAMNHNTAYCPSYFCVFSGYWQSINWGKNWNYSTLLVGPAVRVCYLLASWDIFSLFSFLFNGNILFTIMSYTLGNIKNRRFFFI